MAKKFAHQQPTVDEPSTSSVEITVEPPPPLDAEVAVREVTTEAEKSAQGAVATPYGKPDASTLHDASPESVADHYFVLTNPRFRQLSYREQAAKAALVQLLTQYRDFLIRTR